MTTALELHPWRFDFQVGYPVATSHFAATPQSDEERICAHDFQRHSDAFGTTENACFRAFITLRSQFDLPHCSQRNGNRVKNHPKRWTCPLNCRPP